MQLNATAGIQRDLFKLKTVEVEFVQEAPRADRAFLTVMELETLRTQRPAVPASKHGLESICGASCEIGAH